MRELLAILDQRLQRRGIAASVYVVGGVAVALQTQSHRLTLDVDAMASDQAVFEDAGAMAAEEGLPPNWLNSAAQPWLPPRPLKMRTTRTTPGLDVHLAPPEHLLAMKIIAFRARDVDDIKDLAAVLHLENVSSEDLRDLVARVYGSPEALATALGGPDIDAGDELLLRCRKVARILRTPS